jgi:hypothetical protein
MCVAKMEESVAKKVDALRKKRYIFSTDEEVFNVSPLKNSGDELLAHDSYEAIWTILRDGKIITIQYEKISKWKQKDIDHYRKHAKQSHVIESEIEKLKEYGLYKEGDEYLTTDSYNGYFIVLRNNDICKLKYSEGSWRAELEEAIWWENAKHGRL